MAPLLPVLWRIGKFKMFIICESILLDRRISSFRNVADTVFSIRDQVVNLRRQNKEVLKMLEEEIAARKRLEIFVRNNVKTDLE